jgi:hypothetical protein
LQAKKNAYRQRRGAKPGVDQVLIDDQKFQQKLEAKELTERIEREAKEALVCPGCWGSDWRMYHKYFLNYVANELFAVMVCRRCKRKHPFVTQIEPYGDQAEEDEEEPEPRYYPLGPLRVRRRRRRFSFDQRLRLIRFL